MVKRELMMNCESAEENGQKEQRLRVNWEELMNISPAIFLSIFLLFFSILIIWADVKYNVLSVAVEVLF